VPAAIAEYDRIGQEELLRRYRFDRACQYVLVYNGKPYYSKAVVGVAHCLPPGKTALTTSEFSDADREQARTRPEAYGWQSKSSNG
jgi:hypothetical protein